MSTHLELARLALVGLSPQERAELLREYAPPPAPEVMLTTRQAAEELQSHKITVFRYAKKGLLNPVRRTPRCIRWRKSEVSALIEGRMTATNPCPSPTDKRHEMTPEQAKAEIQGERLSPARKNSNAPTLHSPRLGRG